MGILNLTLWLPAGMPPVSWADCPLSSSRDRHHSHQLQCERRPLEQGVCSAGTPHLMWPFPEPRYGQMVRFRPRKTGCLHQPGLSKPKFVSLLNKLLSSIDGQCTAPPAPSPHLWKITELFQRYEKHSHQILRLQSEIT